MGFVLVSLYVYLYVYCFPCRIEDLRRSVSVLKEKEEDLHSQFEIEGEKKKKLELELLNENKKIRELSKMLEAQQSINEVKTNSIPLLTETAGSSYNILLFI